MEGPQQTQLAQMWGLLPPPHYMEGETGLKMWVTLVGSLGTSNPVNDLGPASDLPSRKVGSHDVRIRRVSPRTSRNY